MGGASAAGFGALGGSGGSSGVAGAGGADAACPLPCENNRECARAAGRAFCDCGPGLFGDQCETRTESIAIGSHHACLLRSDGQVACWGKDLTGGAVSPEGGDFTTLDAHGSRNCGVRSGLIDCWGGGEPPRDVETMTALAVGNGFTCGILASGEVQCFTFEDARFFPGVDDGKQVVAGDDFACALRANGAVKCWGENLAVVTGTSNGRFLSLSAGSTYVCGLTAEQHVTCWGDPLVTAISPPGVEAISVAAGRAHACAVRPDYSLVCWGENEYGQASPPAGQFVSVFAGGNLSCAIDADGRVHCWGGDENVGPAPGGHFIAVSAGFDYACAIAIDGTVSCFGTATARGVAAPQGRYFSLEVRSKACGVQRDGTLHCWGELLEEPEPPIGKFVAVSTSSYDSCAIRESGELACWGADYIGSPPAGTFSHVSVGPTHACAITRDDHQGVCWGRDGIYGIPANLAVATAVASGDSHTCTLDEKAYAACWGTLMSAPGDQFGMIAAGVGYSVGVTSEGRLISWGVESGIEPMPRGTDFLSVSSSARFACALRSNGTLTCWGELKR